LGGGDEHDVEGLGQRPPDILGLGSPGGRQGVGRGIALGVTADLERAQQDPFRGASCSMPPPVKTTGRSLAFALVAVLLFAACTGDEGPQDGATGESASTGTTGESGPTPVGTTNASTESATYEYLNAGLRVVMQVDGTAGTIEIENDTDHEVGKPDFYLLDARTGARSEGRVDAGATVAAGETGSFDVSFAGIQIREIGLVVLLLGRDNYGAFVRTA
jgi:hypothetical protein